MAKRFNAKKKPKHMSKPRWVYFGEDGYLLNNGYFVKAQSVDYAVKFKLDVVKLCKKWVG